MSDGWVDEARTLLRAAREDVTPVGVAAEITTLENVVWTLQQVSAMNEGIAQRIANIRQVIGLLKQAHTELHKNQLMLDAMIAKLK